MKGFRAPRKSLGNLDAEVAATLIMAAADIALIVDEAGVIRDVALNSDDLAAALPGHERWVGRPWRDTVALDSQGKVAAVLRDTAAKAPARMRHVNHLDAEGRSVPVLYSTVPIEANGRIVAIGRDLRPLSALQQRLMDAQQTMERDYSRLRNMETRYRLLFRASAEPVLFLDAATARIVEINPAAEQMFAATGKRLAGRGFADLFDQASQRAIAAMLAGARGAGRAEDVRAHLAESGREVLVSASMMRQDDVALHLVRIAPMQPDGSVVAVSKVKSKLLKVVERAPDAFVVTGQDGRIMTANVAFVDMAQLASEEQALGESLDRWLGRPGVDLDVLLANLRQRGSVKLFATTIRGELGATADAEVSAVAVVNGGPQCFGFLIRNVSPRMSGDSAIARSLPRSAEQLAELIGRVSLKDLVREATDVIERMCIEAALELTGDNRASAAEMLGLSRQSLYTKLRRYGLGDLGPEAAESAEPA